MEACASVVRVCTCVSVCECVLGGAGWEWGGGGCIIKMGCMCKDGLLHQTMIPKYLSRSRWCRMEMKIQIVLVCSRVPII